MKTLLTRTLIIFCAFAFSQGSVGETSPIIIQGVDATALIEYLQASTYTVTVPFKVFHYFAGWGEYQGQFPSDDSRGFDYVKYNATQYLRKFGQESEAYFGSGLYVATDPSISRSYGKGQNWQLAEIEIPVGFRFLHYDMLAVIPKNVNDVLYKLSCGESWKNTFDYNILFQPRYLTHNSKCIEGIREIFKQLRVDAFSYDYYEINLEACKAKSSSAFVILTDQWLKPELVRLFNRSTQDNKPERKRIESLFYKLKADEEHKFFGADSKYPIIISEASLPGFLRNGIPVFWDDLTGESTDADIDSWIKDSLFECDEQPKYEKIKGSIDKGK